MIGYQFLLRKRIKVIINKNKPDLQFHAEFEPKLEDKLDLKVAHKFVLELYYQFSQHPVPKFDSKLNL